MTDPRQEYAHGRPAYAAAAIAALGVLGLYAITLAPTTQFWDASEYIATAHILGIPHPPGNPLFVVLARAWELLLAPTGLSVAVRINLFSATMSALAHGLWFLVLHHILVRHGGDRVFAVVAPAAAVLVSATAFSVWHQSNVNEKVYTVSLFTIALLSWLALIWRERMGRGGEDNLLVLMAFVLALSVGNHLMAFLAAPALLLFVLCVRPRALLNPRLFAAVAVAALLGLSIHVFLPLRAGLQPVINQADPGSWQALLESLSRQQYQKPSVFLNPMDTTLPRDGALLGAQIANYLQYFDWQWARSLAGYTSWFGGARPVVTLAFFALGIVGAVSHFRRNRASALYFAALFATLSIGLLFYLNFRYGFTYPLEAAREAAFQQAREVRERDYFFLAGFSVWGVWAGLGIATAWRLLSERLRQPRARLIALPVLGLALVPLAANWQWATRSGDYVARDFAYNLLMSVEPYGVLFTNGDNDTFPLWYLQEVEGVRKDVTVIVGQYLNAPWYVKQLRQLTRPCPAGVDPDAQPTRIACQRPYENGPSLYAELTRPPKDSIIQLTDEQIDEIATTAFVTDDALLLRAGRLRTTVPRGTLFTPQDTFITAILVAALGDRPIHFVIPSPALANLNLAEFVIRTGLSVRLSNGPVDPDGDRVVAVPPNGLSAVTGSYVDLVATDKLAGEVFVYRGVPEERVVWSDSATANIPPVYAFMHVALAHARAALGQDEVAERHMEQAQRWAALAQPPS